MITKVEAETDREYVDLENVLQDTWEGDIQKMNRKFIRLQSPLIVILE